MEDELPTNCLFAYELAQAKQNQLCEVVSIRVPIPLMWTVCPSEVVEWLLAAVSSATVPSRWMLGDR